MSGQPPNESGQANGQARGSSVAREALVFDALTAGNLSVSMAATTLFIPRSTVRRHKDALLKKGGIALADHTVQSTEAQHFIEGPKAVRLKRDYSRLGVWPSKGPWVKDDGQARGGFAHAIRIHGGLFHASCSMRPGAAPGGSLGFDSSLPGFRKEWAVKGGKGKVRLCASFDAVDGDGRPFSVVVEALANGTAASCRLHPPEYWAGSEAEFEQVFGAWAARCQGLLMAWLESVGYKGSVKDGRMTKTPEHAVPSAVNRVGPNLPGPGSGELLWKDDSVPGGEVETTEPLVARGLAEDDQHPALVEALDSDSPTEVFISKATERLAPRLTAMESRMDSMDDGLGRMASLLESLTERLIDRFDQHDAVLEAIARRLP